MWFVQILLKKQNQKLTKEFLLYFISFFLMFYFRLLKEASGGWKCYLHISPCIHNSLGTLSSFLITIGDSVAKFSATT